MNEAVQVFNETNAERSNIKRSACKKKTGNSKYVKVPSDYLSKKERESKNGECKEWKLSEYYSWNEFKSMPPDIQVEYVNRIISTYDVSLPTISIHLFGKSKGTLPLHFKEMTKHGIIGVTTPKILKRRSNRCSEENMKRFKLDIMAARNKKDLNEVYNSTRKEKEIMPTSTDEKESTSNLNNAKFYLVDAVDEIKRDLTQIVFSTSYIADKVDVDQIKRISEMFENMKLGKLRVIFEVEVL